MAMGDGRGLMVGSVENSTYYCIGLDLAAVAASQPHYALLSMPIHVPAFKHLTTHYCFMLLLLVLFSVFEFVFCVFAIASSTFSMSGNLQ